MRSPFVVLALLCLSSWHLASQQRAIDAADHAEAAPNIIFILTDDQRYDALGCAGNDLARTPHLDSLAARGVRFSNAFVTLSICSPSRAACLTGRYGSANGVTTLDRPLRHGEQTFAQRLARQGYATGVAGKWHLGSTPSECGFQFASFFRSNGPYYNRSIVVDGQPSRVPGFIDDWVADQALRFVDSARSDKRPFALWVCTQVPHMNHRFDWNAREETLALFDQTKMPLPTTWQDDLSGKPGYLKTSRSRSQALQYGYDQAESIRLHWKRYLAAVHEVDASIGRLLRGVSERGLDRNTWYLFMGDNGWFMGEHGLTSKVLPYEESIRVPMIVAGPDTRPRVDDHLVLNIDLGATVLDIAGV
ncbi:MAG: sulfatase-like hydrolase/transferase, partial [Planctomycetes bacterium]|nr:sulfatase-like hydrolase/transferase [Planctomycetota bacterium]